MKFSIILALIARLSVEPVFGAVLINSAENSVLATPKQFPYQVGIEIYKNKPGKSWCGGAIISDSVILTAAQCLSEENIVGVRISFGRTDFDAEQEEGAQRLYVSKDHFVVHEDFDSEEYLNDIALIRLPAPLEFDDFIKSVKLPTDKSKTYDGEWGISSGWGQTDEDDDTDLNYISLPIISNERCRRTWGESETYRNSFFTSRYLCVNASSNEGVSYSDIGGPLVVKDDISNKTVIGIYTFGHGYGELPLTYTRVSKYLDWIEMKMNGEFN